MALRDLALRLIIGARDNASPVLNRLRGSTGLLNQAFSALIRLAPAIGFAAAVKSSADLEEALLKVKAATGATEEQIARLEAEANRLSALPELSYSAEQAGEGLLVLAKAGLSVEQQIGTLNSVMNFAQGQAIDLATAANIITTRLDQWGMKSNTAAEAQANAARVTDVLAKAATLANTDVNQLGAALDNINVQAKLNGVSLENTAAMLDVLAKNGVRGAEAGTYLSDVFSRLNDPTSKISENLTALGISARDMPTVLAELSKSGVDTQAAMAGLDEVTRKSLQIFLSGDAPESLKTFSAELQNSAGYASNASATMGGSLSSAFNAMMSSLDAAARQFSKPFLDPLKTALGDLSNTISRLAESGLLTKLGDAFADLASKGLTAFRDWAGGADFSLLQSKLEQLVLNIKTRGSEIITSIGELANSWMNRWQQINAVATIAVEGIILGFATLKRTAITAKNSIEIIFGGLAATVAAIAFKVANRFANAMELIPGAGKVAAKARAVADSLKNVSKKYAAGVQDDINDIKKAWDGYTAKAEASGKAIRGAWDALSDKSKQSAQAQAQQLSTLEQQLQQAQKAYMELAAAGGSASELDAAASKIAALAEQMIGVQAPAAEAAKAVEGVGTSVTDAAEEFYAGTAIINGQVVKIKKEAVASANDVNNALEENKKKNEEVAEAAQESAEKTATAQTAVTAAVKETGDAAVQVSSKFDLLARIAGAGLAQVAELSQNAAAKLRQNYIEAFDMSADALDRFAGKAKSATIDFQQMAQEARAALRYGIDDVLSDYMGDYINSIRDAAQKATLAFANQSIQLQNLTERYRNMDSAAGANVLTVEELRRSFDFLDDAQLQGAIGEINRLNESARSAAESLADMSNTLIDELDRLQGNQEAIENRRYQQQVEQIKALAAASGESAREQIAIATEIHKTKMSQYKAEAEARKQDEAEKTAADSLERQQSGSSSAGGDTTTTRSTTEPVKTVIVQIGNRKIEVVAGQEQNLIDSIGEALGRS